MQRTTKKLLEPFFLSFVLLAFYIITDIPAIITISWKGADVTVLSVKVEEFPREVFKRGTLIDYRSDCIVIIENTNNQFSMVIPKKLNLGDIVRVKINPNNKVPAYIVANTYSILILLLFFICVLGGLIQVLRYKKSNII